MVENTTPVPGLMGEFGYSVLVDVDDNRFLFDTGNGEAIIGNAKAMGVDWSTIKAIILSHGHFDHTGRVPELLQQTAQPKLYAHSALFTRHMVPSGPDSQMYIGTSFSARDLAEAGAEYIGISEFTRIADGLYATGSVPRITDYEGTGGPFITEIDGQIVPDPIEDDMALVIDHPQGLIIVSGCAHSGMINMINHARQQMGNKNVLAFIGGTHLISADETRLQKTIAALKEINMQKLIVSHCTGFTATTRLMQELPGMVVKGETGMVFEF